MNHIALPPRIEDRLEVTVLGIESTATTESGFWSVLPGFDADDPASTCTVQNLIREPESIATPA